MFKKQQSKILRLHILIFLFIKFAISPIFHDSKARAQNETFFTNSAEFSSEILDWCTSEIVGLRKWKLQATFNPTNFTLSGNIVFTRTGLNASGQNKLFIAIESFDIFDVNGEKIGVIPCMLLNHTQGTYPFNTITLPALPYLVRVSGSSYRSSGSCPPIPFQDDYIFKLDQLPINPFFNAPCPVVNKFQVTPNPVQPGGQATIEWDVSNLFQSRFIRFSGPNLPPTDRNAQTGTLTFQAPSTPGDYDYTLEVFDVNGTKLDCLPPTKRTVTVSGGRYFWLVKRMNPLAPATPYLSPFEYYSETLAAPTPPGSNPTTSFVRIPASGDFEATTPEAAAELEPFKTQVSNALRRMEIEDHERMPHLGLITAEKNQAIADYRRAFESYRQALAAFQNAQPKSGKGLVGPGNLSHARKTSEEISPYDN